MRVLSFLCLAVGLCVLPFVGSGDECTACGCTNQYCDVNGIVSVITNSCQNACSSNCVKMSPQMCLEFKQQLTSICADLEGRVSAIDAKTTQLHDAINASVSDLDGYLTAFNAEITRLMDLNTTNTTAVTEAESWLSNALTRLTALSNRFAYVEQPSGTYVSISNYMTHVNEYYSSDRGVVWYSGWIGRRINQALNELNNNQEVSVSTLQTIYSNLQSLLVSLNDMTPIVNDIEGHSGYIRMNVSSMNSLVSELECDSCGSGSGSGGGGGDGSGGGFDGTAIVAALREIRDRIDYWGDRLYNLIHRFHSDYVNAADLGPFSSTNSPTIDLYYDLSDNDRVNWFRRIESLLYVVAANTAQTDDSSEGDTPSNETSYENSSDELDDKLARDKESINQTVNRDWNTFKQEFTLFIQKLSVFYTEDTGNLSDPIMQYNNGEAGGWSIGVGNSTFVTNGLNKFRQAFKILWGFLTVTLYCLFLIFYVKWLIRAVAFILTYVNHSLS